METTKPFCFQSRRQPAAWARLLRGGLWFLVGSSLTAQPASNPPGLVQIEFIQPHPATANNQACTLVENRLGRLVAAWQGGGQVGALDTVIWLSLHDGNRWSPPQEIANGWDEKDNRWFPCWNPVLFQPSAGPLQLYYKQGLSPQNWRGMIKTSPDNGGTWSEPRRLPRNIFGPDINKPVELPGPLLLCGSSTQNAGWRVHVEWRGKSRIWRRTPALHNAMELGAIQPTLIAWPFTYIQLLCRTRQGYVATCWSTAKGKTWSTLVRTSLPNPNSALDAVVLRSGYALLVYNHSETSRGTLNIAMSGDGQTWAAALELERGDASYSDPAIIQTADRLVHVAYVVNQHYIKHAVINPENLQVQVMQDGIWP